MRRCRGVANENLESHLHMLLSLYQSSQKEHESTVNGCMKHRVVLGYKYTF